MQTYTLNAKESKVVVVKQCVGKATRKGWNFALRQDAYIFKCEVISFW